MMSEQQNAYLKAMGIDVWVERSPAVSAETEQQLKIEQVQPVPVTESEPAPAIEILPEAEIPETLESLNWQGLQTKVTECTLCGLAKNRSRTIFGAGTHTASLMIIGNAPNEEDEKYGEPFSAEAGKLLTAMLHAMGYQRNDVYITNLVKCSTFDNQDPSVDEVAACEAFLTRQVNLIKPDLILALGSITAQRLLKSKSTMSRLRGQLQYADGINAPIIVTYEPAYLLRSPNEKRKAWDDLQIAMRELSSINSKREVSALSNETTL